MPDEQQKQRAVQAVLDNEASFPNRTAAIRAIAAINDVSPDTLRGWMRRRSGNGAERSGGAVPRRRGRPRLDEERDTRALILAAARECVAADDEHTTVRDIAAKAGIAPNALYNYFPSKRDLYDALTVANEKHLVEALRAATTGATSFEEEMSSVLLRLERYIEENPKFPVMLIRATVHMLEHRQRSFGEAFGEEVANRAVARGEITESQVLDLAGFVSTMLLGLIVMPSAIREQSFAGSQWLVARVALGEAAADVASRRRRSSS